MDKAVFREMSYPVPTARGRLTNHKDSLPMWVAVTAGVVGSVLVLAVSYLIFKRLREKMQKRSASPEDIERFHIPTVYLPVPTLSSASSTSSLIEEIFPQPGDSNFLDPNIYLSYEDARLPGSPYMGPGRLCFSVNYNKYSEKLRVKLIRATRLTPKGENVTATPYVKICLLPDKRQRVQSKIRHRTSNPEFFEDFVFLVPERDLNTRTLKFTVCDYDRFSRQQVIGHVMYNLTDIEFLMSDDINEIWMDVCEEDPKVAFPKGEINFSLQFLPTASRLTIAIVKARNLRIEGEHGELYPYVKVSMVMGGKTCRKKKTAICKRTCNPVYNEAFVFTIPPACLERVSLVVSVINGPRLKGAKKLIGRSIVGPYMYSTGEGLEHWKEMLDFARSNIAKWHTLI
ncbi:synaptotagmin-C-like [Actinia tenebrosa]|uniref:Synaptotagmin-C-like n=1 Tax=Actinia tenebrosa TaxID=6105 RepID=A0A6P8IMV0_ACTTE|nr:synaptotagmin-C-like [Actinia tenebrosa]XP_031568147.1 synaptotagmin-C-like [Actinia tenebrosa]XP_031568148.1 synaptotagmin-C-like [Actinia tenebrosa]XP_031568149.1 synaptotagmin-C-like [Actinia tenebrosa]XP_031568150.1 synaptotagmin-C-like [Actinia tenebrosa]